MHLAEPKSDIRQVIFNADLHAHSNRSDGILAPSEVALRAASKGVDIFALTDHDDTSGLKEAHAAAESVGLRCISGVEVSVTWGNKTIHVVGLGIDADSAVLDAGLAGIRAGRDDRASRIDAGLASVGYPGTLRGAAAFAANPALVSRTHFARHLVERGAAHDIQQVFDRYLIEGKPGFVEHRWAALQDALQWITAAGGVAVLAHPARYRFSSLKMDALVSDFKDAGGVAIEVASGNHAPDQVQHFAELAQRFGLEGSRGSDFHGPAESRVELGDAPLLPPGLTPVWHRFID